MKQLLFRQTESTTPPLALEPALSLQRLRDRLPDPDLFDGLSEGEADQWASYLYARPRPETRKLSSRSHAIALYDPFSPRKTFPAGRRWCVNVYTGCAFACKYCYIAGYIREPFRPRVKQAFERRLLKDLAELRGRALHPAPLHASNSTDPLQPLEKIHRHTLFLLQNLQENRDLFSTITLLTKNPELLTTLEYLKVAQALTNFQVEVTCPFYDDESRRFYEPGAPKVESRLRGMKKLRERGVTVSLRIDPLFPRDPLPKEIFNKPALSDYGVPRSQTEENVERLIRFAAGVGCQRIIVSPLKLIAGGFRKSELLPPYRELYRDANGGKPITKGASYRLPWELYQHWIKRPAELAEALGIDIVYCKQNLYSTE